MSDEEALHTRLWRRLRTALTGCGIDTAGSPTEIAARARTVLATADVERFLNEFYFERQYAGGPGRLSETQAEAIVVTIEVLARRAPAATPATQIAAKQSTACASKTPAAVTASALEEAEPYGEETPSAFSMGDSVRAFFRALEERRAAARAEAEQQRRAREELARQREAERLQADAERQRRELEAARQRADTAERTREAAERERVARMARELEVAERRQRELEEQRQREAQARAEAESSLTTRAQAAGRVGNCGTAIELYRQLLAMAPQDAAGWFSLAWYHGLEGDYRQSTRCYASGLALEPGNKVAWNNHGRDLRRRRKFRESTKSLRKALELDPHYATATANLGATQRESGDYRGGAATFAQAVQLSPNDAAAWYWLGVCHHQLRQFDHAARALERAVELNAANHDAWLRLGDCLRKLGRKADARRAYARAGALGPVRSRIGWEAPVLAAGTLLASHVGVQAGSDALAWVAILGYGLTVWRLHLTPVQLFVIAMAALPVLALPFTEHAAATPVALACLLVFTAIVGKVWRAIGRRR